MTLALSAAIFPVEREAKRQALLDAIESLRGVIEAGSDEAEEIGTLPQATVDAIHEAGLFAYKSARVLGGAEADAMIQLEVVEAASRIDPAVGWSIMIGSGTLSGMAAFLGDEAIKEIFIDGKFPRAAGAAAPSGEATPVEGGYRVTGRWGFASGIRHSHYLAMGAMAVDVVRIPVIVIKINPLVVIDISVLVIIDSIIGYFILISPYLVNKVVMGHSYACVDYSHHRFGST